MWQTHIRHYNIEVVTKFRKKNVKKTIPFRNAYEINRLFYTHTELLKKVLKWKKCFLLWTNTKLEKWINVSSLGCRSWTNYFQLQYASPSWSGFLSAADCSRLQAILNNTDFFQIIHLQFLFQSADQSLFQSIIHNSHHVLHQLLPPIKNSGYSLRSQSHQYTLPTSNVINRMLYTNIYWLLSFFMAFHFTPFVMYVVVYLNLNSI